MNRYLKLLAPALLVSAAACAAIAIAASAGEEEGVPWDFKADGHNVRYTGALAAGGKEKMKTDAGEISCEEVTYESEEEIEEEEALTGDTTLALKPRKGGCGGPVPVEFDTNKCFYEFHAGMATSETATEGTAEIACSKATESFTFTVKLGTTVKCTIHVPPQKGLKDVTFTNGTSDGVKDITVDFNLTGVKYSQTKGTGLGACTEVSETEDGTVLGNFTIKGDNKSNPTDIWVEHTTK